MIPQLQFAANVIATVIATYTDLDKGFIYDWITYPLIGLGIVLSIVTGQWIGIVLAALIYGIGLFAYNSGKMGGGDIKLLAGMALVQPLYQGMIFVLGVLLVAAVSASIVMSIWFVGRYVLSKPKIKWKTPRKKAAAIGMILFFVAFYLITIQALLPFPILVIFAVALLFGLVFYALEDEVKAHAFLERMPVEKLEEDELLAVEHLTHEEKEKWGKDIPTLIGPENVL
ncbi:MAG: A24 family peptidase, partial [archaeon]